MDPIHTEQHAGLTVEIVPDYESGEANDPRDCDQLGVMYCWHPDYVLGDEQFTRNDHDSMEAVFEYLRDERNATVIIPLFLLDHSGITMNAGKAYRAPAKLDRRDIAARDRFVSDGAGWDTTHVGFIYCTMARVSELGVSTSVDEIERQLRGEVSEYDDYLTGNVYGYVVKDEDGEVLDSCWGFLGDYEAEGGCLSEARASAEGEAKAIVEEAKEAADWAARDTVTI